MARRRSPVGTWPSSTSRAARSRAMGPASAGTLLSSAARGDDGALYAAAKAEGQVVWYTTLIINVGVRPLVAAFQKKYPGVEVRYSRADSGPTAVKVLNEASAGKLQADIVDGTDSLPPLRRAGLLAKYSPASAGKYPAAMKDPEGY